MMLTGRIDTWPLLSPFRISRGTISSVQVIVVEIEDRNGIRGRGEAAGVDYEGETPQSMLAQVESVRPRIESGIDRQSLFHLLPAGGARNALDCALWDLETKRSGIPAWQAAGLATIEPVPTAYTIGIGPLDEVAAKAEAVRDHRLLKLKADADRHVQIVETVRRICPASQLIVDANQAWTIELLEELAPRLADHGTVLIEQPLPRDADNALRDYRSPVPIAADESCTDRGSLWRLEGKYQFINIKLDKCGGLTEGLALAFEARTRGFGLMVGCMLGSSLGMAPAAVIAQLCRFVDLDGPMLQAGDYVPPIKYERGIMSVPPRELWG
ncbi:MAG: N-acetyl-D-Glu racemase DgcA [Steroidobacteraceae bacterium]